jgi:nucleoside-diphosphate-sugar epimerase
MKRILITAKHSYIGNEFAAWTTDRYNVEYISCRTEDWKNTSFSEFDVVFHVAGIAHIKETKENSDLYYKVNRDLTIDLATKAKADGVMHFIFLSSMSVYGIETGVICKDTSPNPKSNYAISKLQAEEGITALADINFNISIIRPPMVYGKDCKGNYPRLAKLAVNLPIFPNVKNQRSMIYIDNLSEFVRLLIDEEVSSDNYYSGIFWPQNREYVNASEMVKLIAETHGKKIRMTRLFNSFLRLLGRKVGIVNKVFGNLVYEKSMSVYRKNYYVRSLEESIKRSEIDWE